MKNLIDVIEKLDINKVNLGDKFPINGKLHEIVEFLNNNGFELADTLFVGVKKWKEIVDALDKKEGWCYVYSERFETVRFADTSKPIDTIKTNPIYTISFDGDVIANYALEGKEANSFKNINKEEFSKAINKKFG